MTKAEASAAYEAGKHSVSIVWPPDSAVPDDRQAPGMHHCPFPEGDPQRVEYARGVEEALGGNRFDPASVLRKVREELKGGDRVAG